MLECNEAIARLRDVLNPTEEVPIAGPLPVAQLLAAHPYRILALTERSRLLPALRA
jgi:hypothetical protein